jgi:hypothetical protein
MSLLPAVAGPERTSEILNVLTVLTASSALPKF